MSFYRWFKTIFLQQKNEQTKLGRFRSWFLIGFKMEFRKLEKLKPGISGKNIFIYIFSNSYTNFA